MPRNDFAAAGSAVSGEDSEGESLHARLTWDSEIRGIGDSVKFSAVPSLTSTDRSVCATLILPSPNAVLARASVAQTLFSVLSQNHVPDVAIPYAKVYCSFICSTRTLLGSCNVKRLCSTGAFTFTCVNS